jgi:DHA1 family bicyclomycin/chloramphenicol resistance-like MFS transporter
MNPFRHFFHDVAALPFDLKLLALSMFTWAAGEALFIYIAPLYLEQLGGSPVQIGNIISLVGAASAIAMIPAGILTDRWGAKPVLWVGWLIGVVAGVMMAAAGTLPWFAAGWIFYSLTFFVIPAVSGYANASRGSLPPERALTMTSASYAAGNVISPALGGWIAAEFGTRAIFVVAAGLFCLSTAILFFVRPQPVVDHGASPGGNYRALLGNRRFIGFCLLVLAVWVVMWLGIPLAPNYLAEVRGLTVAQVATLGSFNALGWVVLNLVLGRRRPRPAFIFSQLLMMGYLALLLRAAWYGWIALAYLARAAQYTAHSLVNAQATRLVKPSQTGLAFGVLETVAWGGAFIAPMMAGRLYAIDPARPFQIALLLLPATMLLSYFFSPRPAPGAEVAVPASDETGWVGGT